jgi:hypothetical protein
MCAYRYNNTLRGQVVQILPADSNIQEIIVSTNFMSGSDANARDTNTNSDNATKFPQIHKLLKKYSKLECKGDLIAKCKRMAYETFIYYGEHENDVTKAINMSSGQMVYDMHKHCGRDSLETLALGSMSVRTVDDMVRFIEGY